MKEDAYMLKTKSMTKQVLFRLAELGDTTFFTFYYFMGGLLVSWTLDKIFPKFNKTKNKGMIILEIFGELALTIFGAFILFKIGARLPVLFVRYFNQERQTQLDEAVESKIRGSIVISFAIFLLQKNLINKILYIFDRIVEDDSNLLDEDFLKQFE